MILFPLYEAKVLCTSSEDSGFFIAARIRLGFVVASEAANFWIWVKSLVSIEILVKDWSCFREDSCRISVANIYLGGKDGCGF